MSAAEEADYCIVGSTYGVNLTEHNEKLADNNSASYYVCQNCSKTFTSESAVDDHLRQDECNANNMSGMGSCEITIGIAKEISQEISKDKISVKNMYECSHCKVLCPTMDDLASHMNEHEEKVVVVRESGKEHLKRVGFNCTICHKVLGSKGNLVKHQAIHTGIKPFKCGFCDKQFSIKGNKDKHELIHTNTRNFSCEVCRKEFTLKGNLQQHILTHSAVKYFSCVICSKEFTLKGNLDKHIKRHAAGMLNRKHSKYKNPYDSLKTALANRRCSSSNSSNGIRDSGAVKHCEIAEQDTHEHSANSVEAKMGMIPGSSHIINEQNSVGLSANSSECITGVKVEMFNGNSSVACDIDHNEYDIYVQNL